MAKKYNVFFLISLLIIVMDIVVKVFIHMNYDLGESTSIIPNFFNLTYVRNKGAAFGIFAESSEIFRKIFFTIVPPLVCAFIISYLRKISPTERFQIIAFSFIVGGALGNYFNRLYYGYVIDFLDFHISRKYVWPAFNIADIAIVCGVAILFLIPTSANAVKTS